MSKCQSYCKLKQTVEKINKHVIVYWICAAIFLLSVIHVNQKNKREKISHSSSLDHFCNFNKKNYIFKFNSEEYTVFLYIWLLYSMYVEFLIYLFDCSSLSIFHSYCKYGIISFFHFTEVFFNHCTWLDSCQVKKKEQIHGGGWASLCYAAHHSPPKWEGRLAI